MQQHPFVQEYSSNNFLPSQNIPLSKKNDRWKKENMDSLENIARRQFHGKQGILNNYKLINGELIVSEYVDTTPTEDEEKEEGFNLLEYVSEKLALPGFIKNYDIIGQPVRTLEGEMDAFPDVFNVKGYGDIFDNERDRVKTQLLHDWLMQHINETIGVEVENRILQQEEANGELFSDEDRSSMKDSLTKEMSPPEIERYMKTSYRHIVEEWGQNELEDQFERFKIKSLRRKEFHHYLVAGERYRHLYVDNKGLRVESLNPLYVFSSKSPDIDYIQDGDYAGTVKILSVPAIIDRFGHKMTDKEINSLQNPYIKSNDTELGKYLDGSPIKNLSPEGTPYQTRLSLMSPHMENYFPNMRNSGAGSGNSDFLSEEELSKISGTSKDNFYDAIGNNMLVVTQAYWKSQRRIGKLTLFNPETQQLEILIVDENYVVPDYVKQIRNETKDYNAGVNTIIWVRETEIWEGIKISNYNSNGIMREPIYLDIQPAEIQIGKLLIAGQFANNINTVPTGLVDRLKPWQFFFNVLMNQCYHFYETEIIPFMVVVADMIPNNKDWGGDEGFNKFIDSARGGAVLIDNSRSSNGDNLGGQYPKVIDLDMSNRVLSRINLALQIKQLALEQVGISPQRLGEIKPQETATGVQQAASNSYTQTSYWFTSFFECEKEILQIQLDAAKYLQANDKEFSVQTVKSDLSVEALRFSAEDGWLYDLHVYVNDSQKELRDIELAKQLALNNNTSEIPMSARIKMSTSSSVRSIIGALEASEEEGQKRLQQDMQLKQQELQQQGMSQQQALEQAEKHFQQKLANDLNIAIIRALGTSRDNDINTNQESDVLEYAKLINSNIDMENKYNSESAKLQLERDKENNRSNDTRRKEQLEREKRIADFKLQEMKIQQARIQGDKSK